MALIDCKECGNQISDTAAACPKCGAAVPKTTGPDEEQCPHCMTVVHQSATTCPNCRAKKGYAENSGIVYGKIGLIITSGILPFILGAGLTILGWWLVGIIFLLASLYPIYRIKKGPLWFQSNEV